MPDICAISVTHGKTGIYVYVFIGITTYFWGISIEINDLANMAYSIASMHTYSFTFSYSGNC